VFSLGIDIPGLRHTQIEDVDLAASSLYFSDIRIDGERVLKIEIRLEDKKDISGPVLEWSVGIRRRDAEEGFLDLFTERRRESGKKWSEL